MAETCGGPLMLRSPKLQKRASDPDGPKMGVTKIAPLKFFWIWGHLPMGPKWGEAKSTPPCGTLRGQLPIVWFWAPEGEWGCAIGKGG